MAIDGQFLQARTQIVSKIAKLETDLNYWREELKAFDRVETTMRRLGVNGAEDRSAELKLEIQTPPPTPTAPAESAEARARWLNEIISNPPKKRGDLKNLVLKVVQECKDAKLSSTEVERAILQSGYKPTGKNFDIAVYQTLKRLAAAGRIKRKKYAGNVRYSANTEEA